MIAVASNATGTSPSPGDLAFLPSGSLPGPRSPNRDVSTGSPKPLTGGIPETHWAVYALPASLPIRLNRLHAKKTGALRGVIETPGRRVPAAPVPLIACAPDRIHVTAAASAT